jgi:hypothetical protein
VTHVQAAGDIGRRNHYAIRLASSFRLKIAFGFPIFIDTLFDVVRGVGFIHWILLLFSKLDFKNKIF